MTKAALNVLFICADQWRGDCLSAAGHPTVKTPNLDALAAEGVLFRRHFGQCTPCGPARTSLLTGLYLMNHRSGRNGTPLDRRHTNVALEMRRAGYDPCLFGYTDTSPDPRGRDPRDPALTAYDEGVLPGFTTPLHLPEDFGPWIADLRAKGYPVPDGRDGVFRPREPYAKPADRGFRYIPTSYAAKDSETAFLIDRFLQWLSVRPDRPWFAHLVFYRPHPPLIAPEPYNALYPPGGVAFPARAATPEEEAAQHPLLAYKLRQLRAPGLYDEDNPLDLLEADDLEIRQMRAAYFGLISQVDAELGRLFRHLKETGRDERTLIVFTSDHAEMLGEHFVWGKEIYFDQAFHVPLIIRDPGGAADNTRGRIVDAFTQAIDVMPTLLDRVGLAPPRSCDGRSLLPFVTGPEPMDWRREAIFEHDFRDVEGQEPESALGLTSDECSYAAIRDENYKYVCFAKLPPLLFDMRADPHETTNLADRPDMAATALGYAERMLAWRLTHADRTLSNMQLTPSGLVSRP